MSTKCHTRRLINNTVKYPHSILLVTMDPYLCNFNVAMSSRKGTGSTCLYHKYNIHLYWSCGGNSYIHARRFLMGCTEKEGRSWPHCQINLSKLTLTCLHISTTIIDLCDHQQHTVSCYIPSFNSSSHISIKCNLADFTRACVLHLPLNYGIKEVEKITKIMR